jgi:hypothetical protein
VVRRSWWPPPPPPPRSTRDPPHEQLLVRLGVGGVSFVASSSPLSAFSRRSLSLPSPCSTPHPSCEQWLAAEEWGSRWWLGVGRFTLVSPIVGGDVAVSTRDPPREQWLAGLGAGAGSSFVAWHSFVPPSPPHCHTV